jgi:hypothetical protein
MNEHDDWKHLRQQTAQALSTAVRARDHKAAPPAPEVDPTPVELLALIDALVLTHKPAAVSDVDCPACSPAPFGECCQGPTCPEFPRICDECEQPWPCATIDVIHAAFA